MRTRIVLLLLLLLLLLLMLPLAVSGDIGKDVKEGPVASQPDTRAADLLAELAKSTYTAKRAIPAMDGIFVENGHVMEGVFAQGRSDYETAVAANRSVTVSKVELLDRAIQIFFADGKCGLIVLPKEDRSIADMPLPELLDLAHKGISALFVAKLKAPEAAKPAKVN